MARGVKKIIMYQGKYYHKTSTNVTIPPEKPASFKVEEWFSGTTEDDKKSDITWIRQSNNRKIIIYQLKSKTGYHFTISKKLCGSYSYYVEASLSGKRDFKNPCGIYINGYSKPLIIASDWRTQPNSKDIKNGNYISYGHLIYLWLDTEGLNGNTITIEVYNKAFGDDDYIDKYTDVKINNGEVLHKIGNTSKWMSKVKNLNDIEKFYIKAKFKNKYIIDHLGDDKHAIYLNVKGELVTNTVEKSTNITPTKVYKAEVNAIRHEPCKFDGINVTIPTEKDGKHNTDPIAIFKQGQKLQNTSRSDQKINRTVYFKFDTFNITPDTQKILNNILGFLLEHKGTEMYMSGYACVIGKGDYNQKLSQQRSNAVKDFFVSGGLDKNRINSVGRGEYNIHSPDDYKYRNEKVYIDARRVDISFTFAGHDANTLIHHVTSGSVKYSDKLTFDVINYLTDDCYLDTKKHTKEIKIISPDKPPKIETTKSFILNVHSKLPDTSDLFSSEYYAPLTYIWPSSAPYNDYFIYINSCRYYTKSDKATVNIQVHPDIKWTFAFELSIEISHKKFANIPEGALWEKHWKTSQPAGVQRSLINRRNKYGELTPKAGVPVKWGFGLEAEWNKGNSKRKVSFTVEDKIRLVTDTIAKVATVLDQVSTWSKKVGKKSGLPITFDIIYPKISLGIQWYAEGNRTDNKLATVGEIGLTAKPLIGAVGTIDLIAVAALGLGSPAGAKLIQEFRGGVEKLGATIKFDLIFTGDLFITFPKLLINSIDGIKSDGGFILGGTFKMSIKLEAVAEVGTIKSQKALFILEVRAALEIGFGGEFKIDSDDNGVFILPSVEFSGAKIVAEIHGEFGWWSWIGFDYTLEETVIEGKKITLSKTYITGK